MTPKRYLLIAALALPLFAAAFPPYREHRIRSSNGLEYAVWDVGRRFVIAKPEPTTYFQGYHGRVQIDMESYVVTLALSLALSGILAFASYKYRPRATSPTPVLESSEAAHSRAPVWATRVRWITYIGVLWLCGTAAAYRQGYLSSGYWDAWPEIAGHAIGMVAIGGLVYFPLLVLSGRFARRYSLYILGVSAMIATALAFLNPP
jgi:hypothetical protein